MGRLRHWHKELCLTWAWDMAQLIECLLGSYEAPMGSLVLLLLSQKTKFYLTNVE